MGVHFQRVMMNFETKPLRPAASAVMPTNHTRAKRRGRHPHLVRKVTCPPSSIQPETGGSHTTTHFPRRPRPLSPHIPQRRSTHDGFRRTTGASSAASLPVAL